MQIVLQLARALADQNVKLLQKVIRDLPELSDAVETGFNKVWITNQAKLDEITQDIAQKAIDNEII